MKALSLAVLLGVTLAGSARADQCLAVTKKQADAALAVLKEGVEIIAHCEPCNDETLQAPIVVQRAEATKFDEKLVTVVVNGEEQDLAYLYVRTTPGKGRFTNVAKLAKCPASGVSASFDPARASKKKP